MTILDNPLFAQDYEKLRDVSLNPARHTAAHAFEHSERVHARLVQLCLQNDLSPADTELLSDLARLHDIGKISGTARPSATLELLPKYGITDPRLIALAKDHDTNLPWFQSHQQGQPPSDKAWRRLSQRTDVALLCLFMVADRIDCPGGWEANEPLVWFLAEARRRGLVKREWVLDP